MQYRVGSAFACLLAVAFSSSALAQDPITNADIEAINSYFKTSDAQQAVLGHFGDPEIRARYRRNKDATDAFISREALVAGVDHVNADITSGVVLRLKTTTSAAKSALETAENTRLRADQPTPREAIAQKTVGLAATGANKMHEQYVRIRDERAKNERDAARVKIDDLKQTWAAANQNALNALAKGKGFFQSEASFVQEICEKHLQPAANTIAARMKGTPYQDDSSKNAKELGSQCKGGSWALNNTMERTSNLLARAGGLYGARALEDARDNEKLALEYDQDAAEDLKKAEKLLADARAAAKLAADDAEYSAQVCQPLQKALGTLSDTSRTSGYVQGIDLAASLDGTITKLKAACEAAPIDAATLDGALKLSGKGVTDAAGYTRSVESTLTKLAAQRARMLSVYETLKRPQLKAYDDMVAAEPKPAEAAPAGTPYVPKGESNGSTGLGAY